MIKIKKIDIFNYRSCIKTRVEILTDLTTLIGVNGVGKSNILNSIQLLKRINRNRYFHQRSLFETLSHTRLDILLDIDSELFNLNAILLLTCYWLVNDRLTQFIKHRKKLILMH